VETCCDGKTCYNPGTAHCCYSEPVLTERIAAAVIAATLMKSAAAASAPTLKIAKAA